ncbi:MAG: N-acetyl-gamma-glutamyl-phosphate reductase [Lachnospiraceae bacterium]|nr:N-acetyl-gamma-glutamyl-phosphate reductase [Lachnospiraceae bacterium]
MKTKVKVGIIGATGYAGAELVRLLLQREDVEIVWYGSRSYVGEDFSSIYRNVAHLVDEPCKDDDMAKLAELADVVFTATPQGFCASQVTEEVLSKTKVIDLSADFRIKDVKVYEKWYKLNHPAPQLIQEAVYGLPELNRDKIKEARLIANPGCYPTCSFLTLYPMVKEGVVDTGTIIIDAKSGTSGAGRSAKVPSLYCEVNENIKPYGVASHRHTPEIEEQLSYVAGKPVFISFTPHLVPMNRGILVTAYGSLARPVTTEEIKDIYEHYYGGEYFVRPLKPGMVPQTRWVEGSNFADIAFQVDERTHRLVMMGAIDNMVKGAAGQAIQNMNLMFGLPEDTGLKQIAVFP